MQAVPIGLYVMGFGGHGRSVADVAVSAGVGDIIFVDRNAKDGEHFAGYPAIREMPRSLKKQWCMFPAAGNNTLRRAQMDRPRAALATIVAPDAVIGLDVAILEGSLVGHCGYVGPGARVGRGVILNTRSIVEHEVVIGDFTHISVNAIIAGRCKIGSNVFVGAGAVLIDGVSVCDNVIVGAGAVVTSHLTESGTYVGVPARRIK